MEKRYYSQFLYSVIMIALPSAVLALIAYAIEYCEIPGIDDFGVIMLITLVVTPMITALWVWYFPVIISPTGIRSYTLWGIYSSATWNEDHDVKSQFFGLRYLTYRNALGKRLYIPMFLRHYDHFCDDLREWAGDTHPLTLAWRAVL